MRIRLEEKWMQRALGLAQKAGEGTRPNPRVGAVVVLRGKNIGEGYHRRAGGAHAEVVALQKAGRRARGADLYVTLEPCSTHGRTPPCTDAIRRAGIRRVIYGSTDVDPNNAGRADRILRAAGIHVTGGVLREACDRLNADYRHGVLRQQPWVILKLAMTLDGALTMRGRPWITGPTARAGVQKIRAGCDAILVGAETVRKDNPRLTVRRGKGGTQPWRVVVTRSGRLPKGSRIFTDAHQQRTLVQRQRNWDQILRDLHHRGVRRLLVEGGAQTAGDLLAGGRIQEVFLYLAPLTAGPHEIRMPGWWTWGWQRVALQAVGQDLCLHGTLKQAK